MWHKFLPFVSYWPYSVLRYLMTPTARKARKQSRPGRDHRSAHQLADTVLSSFCVPFSRRDKARERKLPT